ncbi:MAG TPA: DUF2846 domain-containing protein [Terriglobales bacterium]|nr:DUF2846 domain-containing protein [Terriglobales bacterium]
MSASLIILLFASWLVPPAAALAGPETQSNSLGAPGCGPASIKFDVETDRNQHAAPNPEPGKALLVLLQDDSRFGAKPRPTTRFGLDGAWVGATHANSYFYVPIDPGEHHLCASWQLREIVNPHARPTAAAHFTAEAGKIYYFRARDVFIFGSTGATGPDVELEPLDSDEAPILLRSFAFSSSHAKN